MYVHVSRHLLLKIACTFSDHTDLAVWLIGQGADVNKSEINGRTNPFEEAVIRDQVQVSYIRDLNGEYNIYLFFLLLNSVYTVLPLSQGLDRVKGGTIHMKTVKYVHTKLCLRVYTEYY